MLLAGFLMVWSQLGSTNLNNARERITHSQIDSAVSAVVYYGNYVKEVATYRRSDGTTPNKSLVQSTTGASNAVLDQVRANGNMPQYLSWFEGVNGLNGYLDSATGQLWVYFYVPASEIHPVDNPVLNKYSRLFFALAFIPMLFLQQSQIAQLFIEFH